MKGLPGFWHRRNPGARWSDPESAYNRTQDRRDNAHARDGHDQPTRESHPFPHSARGTRCLRDRERVGWRLGSHPHRVGVSRVGDVEWRLRCDPGQGRWESNTRRSAHPRAQYRRGDGQPGFSRSRERFRRLARSSRGDDPNGSRHRPRRLLDRRCYRGQRQAALRHESRGGAYCLGGGGREGTAISLHPDRAV